MVASEPVLASLDPEYLQWAKRQAARGGMSVQAFMRSQMKDKDEHQEQGGEMGENHGPGRENGGMMGNMKGIGELMENLPNLMMMKMIFGNSMGDMFGGGQKGLTKEDVQEIVAKTVASAMEGTKKSGSQAAERMKELLYEKAELRTLKELAEGSGDKDQLKILETLNKGVDDRLKGMQEEVKASREETAKIQREAQEAVRVQKEAAMQNSINQLGESLNAVIERIEHPSGNQPSGNTGIDDLDKFIALKKKVDEISGLLNPQSKTLGENADAWDKAGKLIQDVAKGVSDVMGSTGEVIAAKQGVHPKSLGQMPDAPEDKRDYQPQYSSTPPPAKPNTIDGLRQLLPDNGVYTDEDGKKITKGDFIQRYGQTYIDHPEAFTAKPAESPPAPPAPATQVIPVEPVSTNTVITTSEPPAPTPEAKTTVSAAFDKAMEAAPEPEPEPEPEAPKAKTPKKRKGRVKLNGSE